MDNKKHFWTFRYALINATYFAAFCTLHAYAAVYLLDRGFTNTQIGILLAVANVTSALVQPVVAAAIDKQGVLTNRNVCMICEGIIIAGSAALLITDDSQVFVFIVYALIYMVQFTYMPVMTALNFEYQRAGANIFYGLARGLGSAGFAVTSAFIGVVVEREGVRVLLIANIVIMLIQMAVMYFFRLPSVSKGTPLFDNTDAVNAENFNDSDNGSENEDESVANRGVASGNFLRRYPAFTVMLLATILLFFTHNMLNDYLIQIIRPLGGV